MMNPRTAALAVMCFALVATQSGCTSRVNFNQTETLEPGDIKTYTIDAPRKEQKVRVQVESPEPVNVYVGLAASAGAIQKALERDQKPVAAGGKSGVTQDSFEVTIAAGQEFTVFLSGARKRTEVKLSVKSL
jgi:hypothetical protein